MLAVRHLAVYVEVNLETSAILRYSVVTYRE